MEVRVLVRALMGGSGVLCLELSDQDEKESCFLGVKGGRISFDLRFLAFTNVLHCTFVSLFVFTSSKQLWRYPMWFSGRWYMSPAIRLSNNCGISLLERYDLTSAYETIVPVGRRRCLRGAG